jgi:hypothetical protein
MFHRIHQKLGTAGFVISIVALVAALGGGAYAAKNGLTGKQKKEVEKIARKYAGKNGAPGASGPAGSAGAKGDKGDAGTNGTNGSSGTAGAKGDPGATGEAGTCSVKIPTCVLPNGATVGGAWSSPSAGNEAVVPAFTSISFGLRVAPAPTTLFEARFEGIRYAKVIGNGTKEVFGPNKTPGGAEEIAEDGEAFEAACPGSAAAPAATEGFLCVYIGAQSETGISSPTAVEPTNNQAANEFGVNLPFEVAPTGWMTGSWAVTAK